MRAGRKLDDVLAHDTACQLPTCWTASCASVITDQNP
jgi:hypothetical protein